MFVSFLFFIYLPTVFLSLSFELAPLSVSLGANAEKTGNTMCTSEMVEARRAKEIRDRNFEFCLSPFFFFFILPCFFFLQHLLNADPRWGKSIMAASSGGGASGSEKKKAGILATQYVYAAPVQCCVVVGKQ